MSQCAWFAGMNLHHHHHYNHLKSDASQKEAFPAITSENTVNTEMALYRYILNFIPTVSGTKNVMTESFGSTAYNA